jgi:hypothetical protein
MGNLRPAWLTSVFRGQVRVVLRCRPTRDDPVLGGNLRPAPGHLTVLGEYFLYGFKAARTDRSRRRRGGPPALSLTLPCRRPNTARRSAGAKTTKPGHPRTSRDTCLKFITSTGVFRPPTCHCPRRPEPVKGACGVPPGRPLTEPDRQSRSSQLSGAREGKEPTTLKLDA